MGQLTQPLGVMMAPDVPAGIEGPLAHLEMEMEWRCRGVRLGVCAGYRNGVDARGVSNEVVAVGIRERKKEKKEKGGSI